MLYYYFSLNPQAFIASPRIHGLFKHLTQLVYTLKNRLHLKNRFLHKHAYRLCVVSLIRCIENKIKVYLLSPNIV